MSANHLELLVAFGKKENRVKVAPHQSLSVEKKDTLSLMPWSEFEKLTILDLRFTNTC